MAEDDVVWVPRKGAFGDNRYHWPDGGRILRGSKAWTNLTGTVAKDNVTPPTLNRRRLVGTGTLFSSELAVGRKIIVPGPTVDIRIISSITNDTELFVTSNFGSVASGEPFWLPPSLVEVNASTGMMQIYGETMRLADLVTFTVSVSVDERDALYKILASNLTGQPASAVNKLHAVISRLTDYDYSAEDTTTSFVLTGTLTKNGTVNVTGVGTLFRSELVVGDFLLVPGGGPETGKVIAAIANDTHLTLVTPFLRSASSAASTRTRPDLIRTKILEEQLYELRRGLVNYKPVALADTIEYGRIYVGGAGDALTYQDIVLAGTDENNHPLSKMTFALVGTPGVVLTGTLATAGPPSKVVTGTGTAFTTELKIGQMIAVAAGTGGAMQYRIIGSIKSDTVLNVTAAFANAVSGKPVLLVPGTHVLTGSVTKPGANYLTDDYFTPNWPFTPYGNGYGADLNFNFTLNDGLETSDPAVKTLVSNAPTAGAVADVAVADGTYPLYQDLTLTATEPDHGAGPIDHPAGWMRFIIVKAPGQDLTGTVSKAGSTAVVGVGTAFTTELVVGQSLEIPGGGGGTEARVIQSITDDTHLTVTSAFVGSASGRTGRGLYGTLAAQGALTRTGAGAYSQVWRFTPNFNTEANAFCLGDLYFSYLANDGAYDSAAVSVNITVSKAAMIFDHPYYDDVLEFYVIDHVVDHETDTFAAGNNYAAATYSGNYGASGYKYVIRRIRNLRYFNLPKNLPDVTAAEVRFNVSGKEDTRAINFATRLYYSNTEDTPVSGDQDHLDNLCDGIAYNDVVVSSGYANILDASGAVSTINTRKASGGKINFIIATDDEIAATYVPGSFETQYERMLLSGVVRLYLSV